MMGKGPAVKFYDWDPILGATGNNVPRRLTKKIIDVAKRHNIPLQREVITGGGTDAWSAAMAGGSVLAGGISMHMEDMEQTVALLANFIQEYHKN